MPRASDATEVTLHVTRNGANERWVRSFAGQPLVTTQWPKEGLLVDHPSSSTEGLAATIASTRAVTGGVEVHVTFGELATATELALAKWLDGV